MKVKVSKGKHSKKRMARQRFRAPMPAAFPGAIPPHPELYLRREELKFRLSSDCTAHIYFNGIPTQSSIRKLISYLEMSVVDFPLTSDSPPQP
jgi:hypothetical protein